MSATSPPRSVLLLLALLGLAVPVAALLLEVVDGSRRVAFRFAPQVVLPETCLSRTLLHVDCPACGLTRSIVFLAHGRLEESLAMHRLGWLVFLLVVLQVPYRIWQLWRVERMRPGLLRAEPWIWGTLAVLLVANRAWDVLLH